MYPFRKQIHICSAGFLQLCIQIKKFTAKWNFRCTYQMSTKKTESTVLSDVLWQWTGSDACMSYLFRFLALLLQFLYLRSQLIFLHVTFLHHSFQPALVKSKEKNWQPWHSIEIMIWAICHCAFAVGSLSLKRQWNPSYKTILSTKS